MKIKPIYIIIALGILLFASLIYNLEQSSENKSLQKSKDLINEKLEEQKKQNKIAIDSISKINISLSEEKEKSLNRADEAEKEIVYIIKKQKEDEKTILNMRDADSIYKLFAKHYPDNTRPSQASNN